MSPEREYNTWLWSGFFFDKMTIVEYVILIRRVGLCYSSDPGNLLLGVLEPPLPSLDVTR